MLTTAEVNSRALAADLRGSIPTPAARNGESLEHKQPSASDRDVGTKSTSSLTNWTDGPPHKRDDGGLAIVELQPGVKIAGEDHNGLPIIVTRWSGKMKTTAGFHCVEYENVVRHIDIAPG